MFEHATYDGAVSVLVLSATDDMNLAPSGTEPSQEALNTAAEEACKEAEEAEKQKHQKAQEARDAKAAKAKAILARVKAKAQPVGNVR
eukprot:7384363-Prymnesium_polylepis.1